MIERTDVAIIGAGITGLAIGHFLARAGVPHIIVEAEERPGGVIRSGIVDGHLLEWGPQRTRLTAGIREILDNLDLMDEVITAPTDLPLYVYRAGRLRPVPFTAMEFLASNIVPYSSKLRVLLEPLTSRADPDETVADYFTRKVGKGVYENILGPLYGGLYASDPADMIVGLSLGHVLAEFGIGRSLLVPLLRRGGSISPPAACSFRLGMETLPRVLYSANAENVRLGTRAMKLSRSAGWRVEHEDGTIEADRVVLTVPAPAAADLLNGEASRAAAAIRTLRYNPLAVVHLHTDAPLRGLGYQVSFAETLVTRGVTFNESLFGRRGVYTAYLGGARAPGVVEWSDVELGVVACREFEQVTGAVAAPISVARETMPAWDASWAAIRDLHLPEGVHLAANWEARPGLPGRLAQAKRLAQEYATRRDQPPPNRSRRSP